MLGYVLGVHRVARLQVAEHLGGGGLEEELHRELQRVVHRIQRRWDGQQAVVPRAGRESPYAAMQRRP